MEIWGSTIVSNHQQTLLRLLGAPGGSRAPGAQECWDSIRPSRNDQKCHFSVRSSQESHDLSGPFHKWLGGHGSPRLHIIVALLELLEWVCFQACSGVLILSQHISTRHPIPMEVIIWSWLNYIVHIYIIKLLQWYYISNNAFTPPSHVKIIHHQHAR